MLNIFDTGCEKFEKFCEERFRLKSKSISSPLSKFNLPSLKAAPKIKPISKNKSIKKVSLKESQRIVELARERNYDMKRLFTFEIFDKNYLFETDDTLKRDKKPNSIVEELLLPLKKEEYTSMENTSCYIVDVVCKARQIKWKGIKTFKDFAAAFCK